MKNRRPQSDVDLARDPSPKKRASIVARKRSRLRTKRKKTSLRFRGSLPRSSFAPLSQRLASRSSRSRVETETARRGFGRKTPREFAIRILFVVFVRSSANIVQIKTRGEKAKPLSICTKVNDLRVVRVTLHGLGLQTV